MRVLFYGSIFPRAWNVTRGIYCLHVCRALKELGHDVHVVSPRSWLERPPKNAPPMKELADLDVEYPIYFYPPRVMQSGYDHFMALSSRRVMKRTMRDFRPDFILSYWVHPDGAVAARYAHAAGIPAACIVGGSDVLVLAKKKGIRQRAVLRALNDIDANITVGRDLADFVKRLGVPESKVHVIYQGIDTDLFSPGPAIEARKRLGIREEGKMLVSVGNLLPIKGVDILLRAMAILRTKSAAHGDVLLYLVGDGTSRRDLEALSKSLNLEKMVRFAGKVDQRALPDWYRSADLTVLASRSEGVPNVLRETLACGTPFVATRVGGVHEIAEGTTNRMVPPLDPEALAEAINASLDEPRPSKISGLMTWKESTQKILDVMKPLLMSR